MSTLGYHLLGHDNGGRFFPYDLRDCPDVVCKVCGTCLNHHYCPDDIGLHDSSHYDVGATYDNRLIFSEAFIEHCRILLRPGDYLHPIKSGDRRYYYLLPERVVRFDSARRVTRFTKPCHQCGGHESVVGATPVFFHATAPLGAGFFRTDLTFGSAQGKFPLILVGAEGRSLIDQKTWRGLEWGKVPA